MNKSIKIMLSFSLILNILFISAGSFVIYKRGGITFLEKQIVAVASSKEYTDYYILKKDIFESLQSSHVDKVFVGDSITDHGEFQEYFTEAKVLDRGIRNDTSKGVLNRIEEVVKRNPTQVYIMIGVNDIMKGRDIVKYEENLRMIVQSFEKTSTKVIVQSILPVNNDMHGDRVSNETVTEFNNVLKKIAEESNISYLDLNQYFADESGQLHREYTVDGIHLNGKGYKVWIDQIMQ